MISFKRRVVNVAHRLPYVSEAAVRTVYAVVTEGESMPRLELEDVRGLEGLKEASVPLRSPTTGRGLKRHGALRVAVVSGLNNAKALIRDMRDGRRHYDFVEIMACPGGCIGGGGQPRTKDKEALKKRMEAVYSLDRCAVVRKSHENPSIVDIYDKYLGPGFGSELAVETLHVQRPHPPPAPDDSDSESNRSVPDVFPPPPPPPPHHPPAVDESRASKEDLTARADAPGEGARHRDSEMEQKDQKVASTSTPPLNPTRRECHVCGMQYEDHSAPRHQHDDDDE